jgi:hypothetical protein
MTRRHTVHRQRCFSRNMCVWSACGGLRCASRTLLCICGAFPRQVNALLYLALSLESSNKLLSLLMTYQRLLFLFRQHRGQSRLTPSLSNSSSHEPRVCLFQTFSTFWKDSGLVWKRVWHTLFVSPVHVYRIPYRISLSIPPLPCHPSYSRAILSFYGLGTVWRDTDTTHRGEST